SMGGTPVWPLIALSNIAQASAVVGIIISSRKHNEREISVPAAHADTVGDDAVQTAEQSRQTRADHRAQHRKTILQIDTVHRR
ncbi:hypothetical protein ONO39_27895, partial [Salmonella enterica subsp. enterica serovar Anatum]|nr:hypothetical protein [Salmonella enterica subsp. enterica serovar Anatum]